MVLGMGLALVVWAPLCFVRSMLGRKPLDFEGERIPAEKQLAITWGVIIFACVAWYVWMHGMSIHEHGHNLIHTMLQ